MTIAMYLKNTVLKINLKAFLVGLFIFSWATLLAQTRIQLHGKVVDEQGKPVPFASIKVKGTTIGASADEAGVFELSVSSGRTLVVSALNHATKEVVVHENDNNITVTLAQTTSELENVVVVGYGTQKKTDVTGSIDVVSARVLKEVPVANVQNALQGHAAGVEVQTVGTAPGASAVIRIRGVRSVSGSNAPLWVVDGIPYQGNTSDINPDDIASISVLKDASATAIYGSRGSNGVVLVTTKRGSSGPARVSYNGYYGFGTVANKYPVFNGQEYAAMRNATVWGQGYQPQEVENLAAGKYTDWQDLLYQNSMKTNNYFTVAGGNDGTTYSLGGGYFKQTAVTPGQDYSRYTVRLSIDSRLGKWLRVGVSSLNNLSIQNGGLFVNGSTMFAPLSLSPLMSAYNADGSIAYNPVGDVDDQNASGTGQYNPLLIKHNDGTWVDRQRTLHTFNSLFAEIDFGAWAKALKGLKYRFNLGLDYQQQEQDQFRAADQFDATTGLNSAPNFFRQKQGNTASVNNIDQWSYTGENMLTYTLDFGKNHIDFTGLYSIQQYQNHNTSVSQDSMYTDATQYYDMSQSSPTAPYTRSGGQSAWTILSYMARINYSYDNRYMITGTFRDDGSSVLSANNKWHQFGAVSAGWNIMNEKFMRNVNWLNTLKLRAGYGQTASQEVAPYSSLGNVTNDNGQRTSSGGPVPYQYVYYNYGSQIQSGYYMSALPNSNLDWEYTNTFNIGIDYGFLHNRITGAIEYYNAVTNKILFNQTLPPTSGVTSPYAVNVGQMKNWGLEFSISAVEFQPKNPDGFGWTTDLNLFFNKNKLTKQINDVTQNISNQLFTGYSMSSIYDYKKLGIWQTSEAAEAAQFGEVPGQIKIQDYNNDGQITSADRHIIGNGDPKIQGGMTNTFTYKGFDLGITMYARFGGLLVSQIHQPQAAYLTIMDGKRNGIKVDYWTPNNPTNWFPSPGIAGWQNEPVSTIWQVMGYYSGSFLQIQAINLGYTFREKLMKQVGIHSIRVYATCDNVGFLFSPYKRLTGIAPIATNQGPSGVSSPDNLRTGQNSITTISASTPLTRNYTFGLNVNF